MLIHGHNRKGRPTKTYMVWGAMIQRCTNKNNARYSNYGGRGINVCDRWADFQNFLDDMGNKPDGYTLERIDNNEGYCKDNCQWVSYKKQNANRRNNKYVSLDGEVKTYGEWCAEKGVPKSSVHWRVKQKGETYEQALRHFL